MNAFPLAGRKQVWFERGVGNKAKLNRTLFRKLQSPVEELAGDSIPIMAVVAAFDYPQLSEPARWLARNLASRGGFWDFPSLPPWIVFHGAPRTAALYHDSARFRAWVNAFLRHADLGVTHVEVEVSERPSSRSFRKTNKRAGHTPPEEINEPTEKYHEPYFVHSGQNGFTARFPIEEESQGTRRLFWLLAPFYEVLEAGEVVLLDEFGTSLHPTLAREIIRVFHSEELNPKGAQLILATHDSSLLSGKLFRRDQVWFTEKSPEGATDLYSLHDIKMSGLKTRLRKVTSEVDMGRSRSSARSTSRKSPRKAKIGMIAAVNKLPVDIELKQALSRPEPTRSKRRAILIALEDLRVLPPVLPEC